ncbi:MAG: tryptophan synthase subunit alpha [bacterium]
MNIKHTFNELKKKGEAALIAYYTFGFPTVSESIKNVRLLAENGADMIEIGVPFSDPLADGPVIQQACSTALQNKVNLSLIFDSISRLNVNIPLILMSSINPILAYGLEKTLQHSRKANVSGFIIQDLPVDEAADYSSLAEKNSIDTIFLLTPCSTEDRIRLGLMRSKGFIYCVSITGTTGMRKTVTKNTIDFVRNIKKSTDIPVAVGFGISDKVHVKALKNYADGIIVGSRLIKAVIDKEDLGSVVRELKQETLK